MWQRSGRLIAILWGLNLFLPLAGCGKQTYELQATYKAGDVLREELRFSMPKGRILLSVQDNATEGKVASETHQVRETHILAVDRRGQATKLTVCHVIDQTAMTVEGPDGKLQESTEPGILQAEMVVFERVDGQWQKRLFGKEPTPAQAKELAEYADPLDETSLPTDPVTIGESWTVQGAALQRALGAGIHHPSGSMTCQLESVSKRDGEPCAVIRSHLMATGTMLDEAGSETRISVSAHLTTHRSLVSFCDQTNGEGVMKLEEDVVEVGTTVRTTISGPITLVQNQQKLQEPQPADHQ